MADVTELKCWPSGVHAIDWSHDGILALASDEQVDLLFPKSWFNDADDGVSQWRHFPLQVPWFTKDELPVKANAPLHTASIGEEISASSPVSVIWSPPGLAKHRRCALAALTANLVLSIWSSEGKLQDDSSWGRRLIINDSLGNYFLNVAQDGPSALVLEAEDVSATEEAVRLRKRVRAFAWAPSMHDGQAAGIIGTHLSWGQSLIAIANEDNQVVLVSVDSPTSTLGVNENWNCKVLCHFTVTSNTETICDPPLFDEIMQQQRHASHLAWSPWIEIEGTLRSVLAYATNKDIRMRVVIHSLCSIKLGPEIVYPNIDIRYAGPMKWLPLIDGDAFTLTIFTNAEVICLRISALDASVIRKATQHLDGRWDSISGVAFDIRSPSSTKIHFSSMMSTRSHPTALLELTPNGLMVPDRTPNWYDDIDGINASFDNEHDLNKNVLTRMWGLSTSPLGDFLASCHSVHPSDRFEYGNPASRNTNITIRPMSGNGELQFLRRNVSAEAIVFSLNKWKHNHDEEKENLSDALQSIRERLLEVYDSNLSQVGNTSATVAASTSTEISTLLSAFKGDVFLNRNTIIDRYEVLTSTICTPSSSTDLARTMIAFRLTNSIQSLPLHLSQGSIFSKTILAQSRQIIRFIKELTLDFPPDTGSQSQLVEACGFCEAPIPLNSLTEANCTNGHHFTRCGLSFLAIQSPKVTKYCGICKTPFMSDEFVIEHEETITDDSLIDAQDEGGDEGGEVRDVEIDDELEGDAVEELNGSVARPSTMKDAVRNLPLSLARVLFLGCDACIYCGGKYVG